jgi:hypothetical protein
VPFDGSEALWNRGDLVVVGEVFARLEGGLIVEHRTVWDTLDLLEQLGVVPAIRKGDGARL